MPENIKNITGVLICNIYPDLSVDMLVQLEFFHLYCAVHVVGKLPFKIKDFEQFKKEVKNVKHFKNYIEQNMIFLPELSINYYDTPGDKFGILRFIDKFKDKKTLEKCLSEYDTQVIDSFHYCKYDNSSKSDTSIEDHVANYINDVILQRKNLFSQIYLLQKEFINKYYLKDYKPKLNIKNIEFKDEEVDPDLAEKLQKSGILFYNNFDIVVNYELGKKLTSF